MGTTQPPTEHHASSEDAGQLLASSSVYKPPSSDRLLNYATSGRMKYRQRAVDEKSGLSHCPHIKMLVNDVAFLTDKARSGDTVIYAGGTIGAYLPVVVGMFPTVQFLVYDGNPTSQHYQRAGSEHPPNMHMKVAWFGEKEAIELTRQQTPDGRSMYDPSRTLLMVDTRNVTRCMQPLEKQLSSAAAAACAADEETAAAAPMQPMPPNRSKVTEENVLHDMNEQEGWMHILRPRSAMLKFRLPFEGASNYSYLHGKMYLQTFAPKSTTEVRLCVDAPANALSPYKRDLYNAQLHEECMFHHNSISRRMHMGSDCRVKVRPVHTLVIYTLAH